jgi:hypothetical protein
MIDEVDEPWNVGCWSEGVEGKDGKMTWHRASTPNRLSACVSNITVFLLPANCLNLVIYIVANL